VSQLAARAGLRPQLRLAVAAAAALLSLLPPAVPGLAPGGLGLAGQLRGVVGDLSLTTLVLLGRSLWRPPRRQAPASVDDRPVAGDTLEIRVLLAAGGLALYPLTLGLGLFDPYSLGYGSPWLLAALLVIALVGVVRERPLVTTCVALSVLAWALRVCESRNLWDYLLDPLACGWATVALARRASRPRALG
jgi:hypothetical protein